MFNSKTLFIVGAGASKEVGLPTGAELKAVIARTVNIRFEDGYRQSSGDRTVTAALQRHTTDPHTNRRGDINPYIHAGWAIRDAMPQALSIDNFIDAHRDDENIALVGKLGIARCILEAERRSLIYLDTHSSEKLRFDAISNTWLAAFFQLATETIPKAELTKAFENISFITFNYDRCIEHFLVQALKNYYGVDDFAAQSLVSQIPIIHPYGRVGYLPWQTGNIRMAFGGHSHDRGDDLLAVSTQLKTFTERAEDENAVQTIRRHVQEAETIVFLGFAYHPSNMSLIAPETPGHAKRIFGTAKGMSNSDMRSVVADLPEWLKVKPQHIEIALRNELTCYELFGEFWRSMPRAVK